MSKILGKNARVMKLANILDSKSSAERLAGSSPAPGTLAYIIGVAIGDGNLSNPNGRAQRLRISCDTKYPKLIQNVARNIQLLLPHNKINFIKRKSNCIDISCYSNKWEQWLGWTCKGGSKYKQQIRIPLWIKKNKKFSIQCLKGLFQTDGSIYLDRSYQMVNFTTIIFPLAQDVLGMIVALGFKPHIYKITSTKIPRYTIRISYNVKEFISLLKLEKK